MARIPYDAEEVDVFIVEKILDKRIVHGKPEYLLKWFGYTEWVLYSYYFGVFSISWFHEGPSKNYVTQQEKWGLRLQRYRPYVTPFKGGGGVLENCDFWLRNLWTAPLERNYAEPS